MKGTTKKAEEFFQSYATQFDSIYDTRCNRGLTAWINRHLRSSMAIRYQKTFETLEPMRDCTVLDIGCGSGRYTTTCLRLGASDVVGIDLSAEMLSLARASLEQSDLLDAKVSFVCKDFESYSVDKPYDYVIAMGLMDYIAGPEAFLRKMRGAIEKKAVISFPVAESVWALQRKVRYWIRKCPLYFYRYRDLERLLSAVGFSKYSIERIHRDYFVVVEP